MTTARLDRSGMLLVAFSVSVFGACSGESNGLREPENATLVFMSNRDGNAEIYSVAASSTEWVNLTRTQASENWPEWSPDGSRIAYQSNLHGNLDVWVMNADGSDPRRLTEDPAHDYLPAWSPDGTRVTFASWRHAPGDTADAVHIYVMNADGSEQRRLFEASPGTSTSARWAPDGSGFLLSRKTGDRGADLFVVDSSGTAIRRLTDDAFSNGAGVFSPDGGRIAFHSDHGETSDIVVIDVDGSGRRTVVSGGRNWYPRWSPDGRWLVYTARAPGDVDEDLDIYAVPVNGESPPVRLVGGPGREAEARWQPRR